MSSSAKKILLFLWVVTAIFNWRNAAALNPANGQQPLIGDPAPAFQLPDLKGKTFSLTEMSGKLVVIHFATSW